MLNITNYKQAVSYLIHEIPKTARDVFDDIATLAKNQRMAESFGNLQERHKTVHVAGTSGKGSVCYLVDAILRAHSQLTGMTQSPHIYDIRERIQLNGQLSSEKKFLHALNVVLDGLKKTGIDASYFEILTAMGFYTFGKADIDYQIIETGFGGRLDATNVIKNPNKICVLTQIGFDHTHALGNTLEAIATEKAGIIQPHNIVVALRQDPAVNAVFEERCKIQKAALVWVEPGEMYQQTNDALAIATCQILAQRDGWKFDEPFARATLQQVFIPGRFEKRHYKNHLVILDGAHNPQKLAALASKLIREARAPVTVVLAIGERKDLELCLKALKPVAKRIIATEFFTKEQDIPRRPISAKEIAASCQALTIEAIAETSPQRALQLAASYQEPIVITGSFYLLGEVDRYF